MYSDLLLTFYKNEDVVKTGCGIILRRLTPCNIEVKEHILWNTAYKMLISNVILQIRKAAQYNISAILKGSSFMVGQSEVESIDPTKTVWTGHPAAGPVAEFCIHQIRSASEMGNTKTTLHTLVLLRQVIMCFPRKQLKVRTHFSSVRSV